MTHLRIASVDDVPDLADALCALIELEGHKARAFYSAQALLADPEALSFDLYWLDVGMPGMTGYELARALRERLQGQPRLIYTLSGYGDPQAVAQSAASGCDAHYVKPLGVDLLFAAMQQAASKIYGNAP